MPSICYPWLSPLLDREKIESAQEIIRRIDDHRGHLPTLMSRMSDENRAFIGGDGNWKDGNPVYNLYRCIQPGGRNPISRLRWFTIPFSGYSPLVLEGGPGSSGPYVVGGGDPERIVINYPNKGLLEATTRNETLVDIIAVNAAKTAMAYYHGYHYVASRVPPYLSLTLPLILGEAGFHSERGGVVNFEAFCFLRTIAIAHHSGVLNFLSTRSKQGKVRILEIGGGFGGVAYFLKTLYPNAEYTIIDLPESLAFSSIYLQNALGIDPKLDLESSEGPSERVTFVTPYAFVKSAEKFAGEIDLVINTFSMAEMAPHQVERYGSMVRDVIQDRGVFLEINNEAAHCNHSHAASILKPLFEHGGRAKADLGYFEYATPNVWMNSGALRPEFHVE